MEVVKVFAPATVANLGPGFDILGLAVNAGGDTVEARKTKPPGVVIEAISGDSGRLPLDPAKNTAGVAAAEVLKLIGASGGISLRLQKGLTLGSGLGSSAASAAAATWAVGLLYDVSDKRDLLPACLAAEEVVSGYHADNVAPALLGGLILISGYKPLRLESLPVPTDLYLVLTTPNCELPTTQARAVLPKQVSLKNVVANSGNLGSLIMSTFRNDVWRFGTSMVDTIIEPVRAHLIPGFGRVKQAALDAGAFGCSISGAGPTVFAVCDSKTGGEKIGAAMQAAFAEAGLHSVIQIVTADKLGARQL